jgi:hypothetical protein
MKAAPEGRLRRNSRHFLAPPCSWLFHSGRPIACRRDRMLEDASKTKSLGSAKQINR